MPLVTSESIDGKDNELDPLDPEVIARNPDEQPPFGTAPTPGHADIMNALGTGRPIANVMADAAKDAAFENVAGVNRSLNVQPDADEEKAKRVEGVKDFVDARNKAIDEAEAEGKEFLADQEKREAHGRQARAEAAKASEKNAAKVSIEPDGSLKAK